MSVTLILFGIAALLSIVCIVLHFIMVVQGFKTSTGKGLLCLLVPMYTLIFAFTGFESKKRGVFGLFFLIAIVGSGMCWGIASYQTVQAAVGSAEAAVQGLKEAEDQIEALQNLEVEDMQLDL